MEFGVGVLRIFIGIYKLQVDIKAEELAAHQWLLKLWHYMGYGIIISEPSCGEK